MINKMNRVELFVPGRLCILGEHSDWAGMNRAVNGNIEQGMAIVTGIEQGIHAWAKESAEFELISLVDGETKVFREKMSVSRLRKVAAEGGYFSYIAGSASYMKEHYHVGGVKITIDEMTLPMKKGLSSSAAICVLVVKAFNQLYRLNMSTLGIMQAAYRGEQRTPSRCGRLDQACAYGIRPVVMTFDGGDVEVKRMAVHGIFYWVYANLNASKDTVKILADLGKCYPFAQNEMEKKVQDALGKKNREIIHKAVQYFEDGDAESLGKLLTEAQQIFDRDVAPACPSQLAAPVLHSVLEDDQIKKLVYGAKGVGSQGDGTVQFLAKDEMAQTELIQYMEKKWGMQAYKFTVKPQRKVRKAIIPVAGFGTRVYPATRRMKKEFFPVVEGDLVKPAILILLEELDRAGIEKICLVIGEGEKAFYDEYFSVPLPTDHYQKLTRQMQEYEDYIMRLSQKLHYVVQQERKGFGHAVYQCSEFADGQPVLLLLGDTVYQSNTEISCVEQLLDAYERTDQLTVGVAEVPLERVGRYGILAGKWEDSEERMMEVGKMFEKPSPEVAKENLTVAMEDGSNKYFMVFGNYVLTPDVFDKLDENIAQERMTGGEYQLTDALEAVRKDKGMIGYRIDGNAYDIGNPEAYRKTVAQFALFKSEE